MSDTVVVALFLRDESNLSPEERAAVDAHFTGRQVEYRRIDPKNFQQHADECENLHPAVVLLPLERPIPSLAIEQGVIHAALTPGGLRRVKSITVVFEPMPPPDADSK